MIGALAGAAVAGVGAVLQYRAQQEANQIAWRNLYFQQQQARRQNRLAEASRSDIYGNKTGWNDLTGEWENELTPITQQIVDAEQSEQLKVLTEDAARNRATRERQERRSKMAGPVFDRLLAEYQFTGPGTSSKPTEAEFVRSGLLARDEGVGQAKDTLMRQALRMGRGQDIAKIINEADQLLGKSMEQTILQGKQLGKQEYRAQVGAHENKYLPALAEMGAIANKVDQVPITNSGHAGAEEGRVNSMFAGMTNALQSEARNVGGAYSDLVQQTARTYPDLSPVASALGRLNFNLGGGSSKPSYISGTIMDPYSTRMRGNVGAIS